MSGLSDEQESANAGDHGSVPAVLTLKQLFAVLVPLMVAVMVGLALCGADLSNSTAPRGIVSFEFCGFTGQCEAILCSWRPQQTPYALLSLGIDYLFLVVYPAVIAVGLLRLLPSARKRARTLTVILAWSMVVAGLADAVENYCLIQLVLFGADTSYGMAASVFATIKFVLILLALLWWMYLAWCCWRSPPASAHAAMRAPDDLL